ncbi:MAG: response regulator [Prolixibacteraceae bacterium]
MAKVLIIENSSFMKGALSSLLEYSGRHLVVGTAEDGPTAVNIYKRYRPGIVTCDILMGGLDGISILKMILKEDPAAKVIMVSVFGQELKLEEARRIGSVGFIYKPYKHSEIEDEIQRVLSKQK